MRPETFFFELDLFKIYTKSNVKYQQMKYPAKNVDVELFG